MTSLKYFTGQESIEELRKSFYKLCLRMHPDKGGDHLAFVGMKNEYDYLCGLRGASEFGNAAREKRAPRYSAASEKQLREMIEKLIHLENITIEICGCWLWITGNTFAIHTTLSALGLKFSGSKKAWYYAASMQSGKIRGRYSDMNKIRNRFGSETIETMPRGMLCGKAA